MAFCPNCGSQVQGAFCARCGAPMQPPPQQQATPPQQPPQYGQPQQQPYGQQQYGQPPYPPPAPAAAGMEENVACALCYLFTVITGVLFLVLEPYNKSKTVRFHAFQAIFFGIGVIVIQIVLAILFAIMRSVLNYSLWFIPTFLSLGASLLFMCAWAFLIYKAYNREMVKIPVIGDLAEKQA